MTREQAFGALYEAVCRVEANARRTAYRDSTGFRITGTPMWADLEDARAAVESAPADTTAQAVIEAARKLVEQFCERGVPVLRKDAHDRAQGERG